jgi:hypothetical protein
LPANIPHTDKITDFSRIEQEIISEEIHVEKIQEIKDALNQAKKS